MKPYYTVTNLDIKPKPLVQTISLVCDTKVIIETEHMAK